MKNKVLLSSIMFSTLILGGNVFVESANNVLAMDNSEIQNTKVQNKVRFEESDGAYVEANDGSIVQNYFGNVGEKIQLDVPSGFKLKDINTPLIFDNDEKGIKVVKVEPKIIENTIIFVMNGIESNSIVVSGKTNSFVPIPENEIPEGYHIESWDDKEIKISGRFPEHRVYLTDEISVENTIEFVDETKNVIKTERIYGNKGSRKDISDVKFEYSEYKLAPNQKSTVVLQSDGTVFKVNVVSLKKKNTLIFKDSKGNIINESDVYGGFGRSINILEYIHKDYMLAGNQEEYFKIEKENDVKEFLVQKNKVKNKLIFKDEKGNQVGDIGEIEGAPGTEYYNYQFDLPEDYELQDHDGVIKMDEEDDYEHVIKVKKVNFENTLIFKDTKGITIFTKKVKGPVGEYIGETSYVPKGYIIKSSDVGIKFDDKETTFEIIVINADQAGMYQNIISIIDENNKEIFNEAYGGELDDEIEISKPVGYEFIDSNKIKIKAQSGYIHKIRVKPLTIKNKLTLNDYYTGEELETIELTGLTGSKLLNSQIPSKYRFGYDVFMDAEYPNRVVRVKRIIKTVFNFIDIKGNIVGKQVATTIDRDEAKLNIPKGYTQAMGDGYIQTRYGIDSYNVLVVSNHTGNLKPSPSPQQPNNNTSQSSNDSLKFQVVFIDRDTKKKIHSVELMGKHGQSMSIVAPDGYEFVNNDSSRLTLDKSKKNIEITVQKKFPSTAQSAHLSTVQTKQTTSLFDKNGKQLHNRALAFNTGWKTDQKLILNGITYYRVGNNEYVKASDVVEYEAINKVVNTTSGSAKYLYDINGKKSSLRALASGSAWFSDKVATINGEKMYRVATNEWVKASDVL